MEVSSLSGSLYVGSSSSKLLSECALVLAGGNGAPSFSSPSTMELNRVQDWIAVAQANGKDALMPISVSGPNV